MRINVVGIKREGNKKSFTMRVEVNGVEVAVENLSLSGAVTVGAALAEMRARLLANEEVAILRAAERLEKDLENG